MTPFLFILLPPAYLLSYKSCHSNGHHILLPHIKRENYEVFDDRRNCRIQFYFIHQLSDQFVSIIRTGDFLEPDRFIRLGRTYLQKT
jgi:hypothetical protein